MTHAIDLVVMQDAEFTKSQLLSALYAKLHRALATRGATDVAVSFPEYRRSPPGLGSQLRLIGSELAVNSLASAAWLGGMRSFVQVCPVREVPPSAVHHRLRRVQAKSNPDRLRRRQMLRHGITFEEAVQRVPDACAERLQLPFVQLSSSSTGHPFRLFLELGPALDRPVSGSFNAYGLSSVATIPIF